jgi:hypothetical protein
LSRSKTSFVLAGSRVSTIVGERATFFIHAANEWRYTLYTSHTTSFLIEAKNFFSALWRVGGRFGIENTTSFTVSAQVLLVIVAIAPILNDILAVAFRTAMDMGFGNHAFGLIK